MRPLTLAVASLIAWSAALPVLSAQEQVHVPHGYVLVDDMILPEEVVLGDATFTATPWPFGVVPYAFNANVTPANQTRVLEAMADISAVCGVIFIPHTTTPDWLIFNSATVNSSPVGVIGGGQTINISSWAQKYVIIHEIMHSLGFLHEQQRPDRDSFITVNVANISTTACPGSNCPGNGGTSCLCNFNIVNGATMATPYDFLSIMHYGRTAFTANGLDTITCHPAFAGFQGQIGNRAFMSQDDAQGLQQRYGQALVSPTITSISPPFVTTATGTFTLHVYGSEFNGGSPSANGVQGTQIRWNGSQIPTTFEDSGHLTAQIPATSISTPQQVQISVVNPAPGTGFGVGSMTLSVSCQAGGLGLANGVPVTVTNGCQQYFINPVSNAFNVVAVSSISDWNLQMGTAQAASGGNECDFVVGGGWFGSGTIQPTSGNVTLLSGFSPARLQHVTSTEMRLGQPTLASIGAGSNVRAFHFSSTGFSSRTIQVAGPTTLRWKLLAAGNSFAWRSSETNAIASGTVGGAPVTGIGIVPGPYCLVVYKNGSAPTTASSLTLTMCFDFTPTPVTASSNVTTINACVRFTMTPQSGRWNVVGVSSPTDWDIQVGTAASEQGGSSCDYVLANGRLGSINPLAGICSPYTTPGSSGYLQFGVTTTVPPALGSQSASATDVIGAFEFEVTSPGNYDIRVSATGYSWDLHGPGTSSAWRRAVDRIAGPLSPATTITIPNLSAGWHCVVVYHNGGIGSHGFTQSILVVPSATQPPVLSSIAPDVVASGSGTFSLTAYGSAFTPTSSVRWNGASLPTTYVSDSELLATVDGALVLTPGTASITVSTPGSGTSSSLPFVIGNPIPVLTSISPAVVTTGEPTIILSAFGSDFVPGAEVRWNGAPLPTTVVNAGQLDAVVDSSLLFVHSATPISVFNPGPGGGESGYLYIVVQAPQITAVTPTSIPIQTPSAAAFTVNVSGIFFNPWSVVHANEVPLPTTFIDTYTLDATLDPSLLVQSSVPGAIGITVGNTVEAVSNIFALVVESGNNLGLIRTHPLVTPPAAPFALWLEAGTPFAPLTLIADLGSPVPLNNWPDPSANFVMGVTEFAGSNGQWLTLVDGIGLFGPSDASAFDAGGFFVLPGFLMPDPLIGISVTLQAIYIDPSTTLGFQLSWPLHGLRL